MVFSGASDKFVASWDLGTLKPTPFAIKMDASVYSLLYITEKNTLLIGTISGNIHVVNLDTKTELKILTVFKTGIFDLKFSGDSFYAASSDGHLAIGNLNDFTIQHIIKVCDAKIRQMDTFENHLALACGDGYIRIMDINSKKMIVEFEAHNLSANAVKYRKDGTLLSGGRDAHLKLWNSQMNYSLLKSIPAHNFAIYAIALQPNGNLIATASRDKTAKIWDEDLNILARLDKDKWDGHINSVNALLWHAGSGYLVSTGDDRSVIVWEVKQELSV